jgi:hypothetical protein
MPKEIWSFLVNNHFGMFVNSTTLFCEMHQVSLMVCRQELPFFFFFRTVWGSFYIIPNREIPNNKPLLRMIYYPCWPHYIMLTYDIMIYKFSICINNQYVHIYTYHEIYIYISYHIISHHIISMDLVVSHMSKEDPANLSAAHFKSSWARPAPTVPAKSASGSGSGCWAYSKRWGFQLRQKNERFTPRLGWEKRCKFSGWVMNFMVI